MIAAATDLDIGARVLENTNQATLFSGNDMRIGRQLDSHGQATGKAEHVLNRFATIEALGKLSIHTSLLQNMNDGVEFAEVPIGPPYRVTYVQPDGDNRKYLPEELQVAGLGNIHRYSRTEFVVDHTEFQSMVVRSSPAKLTAGGDLLMMVDDLLNDNSQITAAGQLVGTLGSLRNQQFEAKSRIHESGTSQFITVIPVLDFAYKEIRGPVLPYTPVDQIFIRRVSSTEADSQPIRSLRPTALDKLASRQATEGSAPFLHKPGTDPLRKADASFTQRQQWLNSDVMLAQLAYDPERLQKRIGDGYIEQRLIREQIAQLTGRRFLPGQDNDEAQYATLMTSGLHQATALQLQPGIALTSSQVAKLTADIVWLVEQEIDVQSRDGQAAQMARVLVPRVYVLPRAGDLGGSGALISARRVVMSVADAIDNAGTISGTEDLQLQARTISNSGSLTGDSALLVATDDINVLGGEISTRHQQQLWAGRDIRVASSTRDNTRQSITSRATGQAARTNIDRVALLHVAGSGDLQMLAGRDIALDASQLDNDGSGNITAIAGRDLTLGTITTRASQAASARGSANFLREAQSTEVGTAVQANGSIVMAAGQNLATRAAGIDSTNAAVILSAEGNLAVSAGESSESFAQGTEFRNHGLFSSGTSTRRTSFEQKKALASTISGNSVELVAGQDLSISGSDVTSDRVTRLQAGRDVSVTAATESSFSETFRRDTRSGLFSGPGLSIGIGSQRQQNTSELRSTGQRGSQVGMLAGDISIEAGDSYHQQASKVAAPKGSVFIQAGNIDITGGIDTSDAKQASSFSQSGLSITLSNPVIDAARSLESLDNASKLTRSSRAQMLAAAAAGLTVADTAKQVAKDPTHAGGVTLAVTLGSNKSESTATEHAIRVAPPVVAAGGNVDIRAQGGPDAKLAVTGSQIVAADSVALKSDGELVLEAQTNTDNQSMSSRSSSTGIGLAASIGKEGMGLGIIANTSKAKGKAAGNDGTWTNTEITAGRRSSLRSKGDSRLKGAIVKAPTIDAHIGGDLLIESLQDSSRYESHQQSLSGSVTLPMTGGSPSAQFNASRSAIHSHYLSSQEASGFQAGDGGFQVQVTGKTDLQGAAIASTDAAVNAGTNQFSSAGLAMSDLNNHADYEAEGFGVGIGIGRNPQGEYAPKGSNAGLGSDSGHQRSVTAAGISGIAGNQAVRTDDASSGLAKIFDAERVAKEINAQVTISQEFSGKAYKAVDDYVTQTRRALELAKKETEVKEVKQMLDDQLTQLRREEQVINVLIGALVGTGGTAITKEGLSSAAERMRFLMIEESRRFAGITDGTTTISNSTSESEGVRGDYFKLGGSRIDIDIACGQRYQRCKVISDEFDKPILDSNGKPTLVLDEKGRVQFDPKNAGATLEEFMKTDEGRKMVGPTGGVQGMKGTLFGIPYRAGSWQDQLIEAYAGTHDYIGGKLTGLYDEKGNIRQGMTPKQRDSADRVSAIAILPSTPFAMAELLSPAAWQAISIFLRNAK